MFYGLYGGQLKALNKAGRDGWIEYRRAYFTEGQGWVPLLKAVVDLDDLAGFVCDGPLRSMDEFWLRRPVS